MMHQRHSTHAILSTVFALETLPAGLDVCGSMCQHNSEVFFFSFKAIPGHLLM